MDKFILRNISKTNIGFTIYTPSPEGSEFMSQHKRRKFKNSGNFYINLSPNSSINLVDHTGMSVNDLMDSPELRELINLKSHKVNFSIEREDDAEDSPPDPVEVDEDIKEEPKEKAKGKKKAKKAEVAPPPPMMPPIIGIEEK